MASIWKSEPLRSALYPLIVLVVGYLVVKGAISRDDAEVVLAGAVLLLGAAGVELARSQVSPVSGA